MNNRKNGCPTCGSSATEIVQERRNVTASDGTQLEFTDVFTRCTSCGEQFYTGEQSLASSRAAAGVLRKHENLLSPEEIRAIRTRYGLTQSQLEQALGLGAKTVVRWEKGTVRQSRTADALLRAIAEHADVLVQTAARNGIELGLPIALASGRQVPADQQDVWAEVQEVEDWRELRNLQAAGNSELAVAA